jgi:hypothetical protein
VIEADRLVAAGRLADAVDVLAAAYRSSADPALAIRLVDLRHQAARSYVAPGLEVIPRRIVEILPVDDGPMPYAVSFDLVREIASETPTIRPEFAPGDAIMFDERFLHRTYLDHPMSEPRYALESWFFAPSHATSEYVPFLA